MPPKKQPPAKTVKNFFAVRAPADKLPWQHSLRLTDIMALIKVDLIDTLSTFKKEFVKELKQAITKELHDLQADLLGKSQNFEKTSTRPVQEF